MLLDDLEGYFGEAPIVAHNAQFDVTFMNKHGLLGTNPAIDTYELAAILLPSAPRYNLGSLTTLMGIDLARSHRAFDDAVATGHLYWKLWEALCQLPSSILSEIITASSGKNWASRDVFQAALKESLQAGSAKRASNPFVAERLAAQPLDISDARREQLAVEVGGSSLLRRRYAG